MHPRRLRCFFLKYCPVFSVVAPCRRGASAPSVRRRSFTTGCQGTERAYAAPCSSVLRAPRGRRRPFSICGRWKYGRQFGRVARREPATPDKSLKTKNRCYGGEGGIRTRHDPLDSVSCRFYIAAIAVNASDAVAPCTRLHSRLAVASNSHRPLEVGARPLALEQRVHFCLSCLSRPLLLALNDLYASSDSVA